MPEMRLSTYYCVSLVTLYTSFFIVAQNWVMIGGRTLEMAPSRVGLGAVFFAPNNRFILCLCLCL